MLAVYKREVRAFFCSMMGYVYTAFTLLIAGIFFWAFNLRGGIAEFGYVLGNTTVVLLIIVPVITMRLLCEEQRQRTDQLLFTAPVRIGRIVLGKYLAVLTVFCIPLTVLLLCPLILSVYGQVPLLQSYSCFLAFIMMGAACLAIGVFISSLTDSQILAAVGTFAILLASYLMNGIRGLVGQGAISSAAGFALLILLGAALTGGVLGSRLSGLVTAMVGESVLMGLYFTGPWRFEGIFSEFLEVFSLFDRYYDFAEGMFDVTHLVYYLGVTVLFLYFTVQSIEKRRWN